MKKIINWGLIGLGNASLNLAKEFKNINNSNLLAVASRDYNKRKFYEQKFKIQKENIFSDYEDIFKALKYEKNILVEKPITKNFENFKNLKKKFLEKNLLLEDGLANKFHPFYHKAFEEIIKLDFNKIYKIKSSFGNDALGGKKIFGFRLKRINHKKKLFNKKLDGGSILDGGIYPISFLIDMMYSFEENFTNNFSINSCNKNISNDVDIESSIKINLNKIDIELKTSLINKLKNNFKIYTREEIITFKNIFTIDSNSAVTFEKNEYKNILNKNENSSYFYEVKEISDLLINQAHNFSNSLNKLEHKIEILSAWFKH